MAKVLVKLGFYHWVEMPCEQPKDFEGSMDFYDDAVQLALLKQFERYPAVKIDHDIAKVEE